MLRTSVRGTYNADKSSAAASFIVSGGDVKLKASMTDATVVNGPSLNGLSLSLEKPGAFMIDYNVPKKDVRFQFMNSVKVADKPLNLTYVHAVRDNRTTVDGSLVLDPANKVSANYAFGSGNCKVKYTYVQGQGSRRTFEPCYDFSKNAWDFAFSQRVFEDDVVRASYHTSNKILGLDWTRSSKNTGSFKVSTSFNLNGEFTAPKITAESTWNFDLF